MASLLLEYVKNPTKTIETITKNDIIPDNLYTIEILFSFFRKNIHLFFCKSNTFRNNLSNLFIILERCTVKKDFSYKVFILQRSYI
jgi:hypothetical protein